MDGGYWTTMPHSNDNNNKEGKWLNQQVISVMWMRCHFLDSISGQVDDEAIWAVLRSDCRCFESWWAANWDETFIWSQFPSHSFMKLHPISHSELRLAAMNVKVNCIGIHSKRCVACLYEEEWSWLAVRKRWVAWVGFRGRDVNWQEIVIEGGLAGNLLQSPDKPNVCRCWAPM